VQRRDKYHGLNLNDTASHIPLQNNVHMIVQGFRDGNNGDAQVSRDALHRGRHGLSQSFHHQMLAVARGRGKIAGRRALPRIRESVDGRTERHQFVKHAGMSRQIHGKRFRGRQLLAFPKISR